MVLLVDRGMLAISSPKVVRVATLLVLGCGQAHGHQAAHQQCQQEFPPGSHWASRLVSTALGISCRLVLSTLVVLVMLAILAVLGVLVFVLISLPQ